MITKPPADGREELPHTEGNAGPVTAHKQSRVYSFLLLTLGCVFVGIGFIGIFLPVLPTTPFLLIAVWAFARSSPRFHNWLLNHKTLGPYVREWNQNRAIPVKAKIMAVLMMTASFTWLAFFSRAPSYAVALVAVIMLGAATFVLTRPSSRPG